ncbi:MAG: nucleotide sugar dehydrogenase [Candidatus Calescibacterium sp.]|nr:nucleotide sugar dehydrogenase [Candidatus Calescibacterium sp.]MCX7972003.1 nucleotide sugar dehydrogenase [bacterium]MDW8195491.1 nucleotide sugar dehydrogenase [Candidatus Calescibacterium sp.]
MLQDITQLIIEKIEKREVKIGVIGLGYVGLPIMINFSQKKFKVIGFDVDQKKVELINQSQSYIKHISSEKLQKIKNYYEATTNFSRLKEVDFIIIAVPTPLDKHRNPDMTYVFGTTKIIRDNIRKYQTIILESTTYPGTTEEDMKKILEESGLKVGVDFFLGFSPEREDPGNKKYSFSNIPKIVSGCTSNCLKLIKKLYEQVVEKVIPVSSPKVAEATKLLENIYRSVNIALVNELKIVFDKMGIDIWEVIEAAKTKPFGFHPFYPGPGMGGHCIPIDPFYLTWKAKEYDISTKFIELAGEINTQMPYFVIQKLIEALNKNNKSIFESKILVLGVAYKKDVDDARESPALKIIDILLKKYNCKVDYNDPYIPELKKFRKYKFNQKSVELTEQNLKLYDAVLIITDHSAYDPKFIIQNSKLVIDTRNLIKGYYPNLVKA